MSKSLRTTVLTGSILTLATLGACQGPQFEDASAPPSGYLEPPPPAPPEPDWRPAPAGELLGGPQQDESAAPYDDHGFGTMAPIPNPEDLDEEDRRLIYGDASVASGAREIEADGTSSEEGQQPASTGSREWSRRSTERADVRPTNAKVASDAPRPAASPATPKAASPVRPAARQPTPAPSAAAPANIDTVAEALGSAVAGDVTGGATLDIPQTVRQGKPGVVVLTLPKALLTRLQTEASRLGLTEAARQVDALAILSAEGYDIVPTAEQSARLAQNAATSLSWNVTPKAQERAPFQALVSGELKGGDKPTPFWIAVVEQPDSGVAARREGDGAGPLDLPGMPLVTVPGFGQVRSGVVILFGVALLILILLAAAARRAHERRRAKERENKARRLAEFSKAEEDEGARAAPGSNADHPPPDKGPQDA